MEDSSLNQQTQQPQTLEEYFYAKQEYWNGVVHDLFKRMKSINELLELQPIAYSCRQMAVDSYYYMLNLLDAQKRIYNITYANEYNKLKTTAQIRYTTEAAINAQIAANMADMIYKTALMSNHTKYMLDTIKSIDNVIFGIKDHIELLKIRESAQFNG